MVNLRPLLSIFKQLVELEEVDKKDVKRILTEYQEAFGNEQLKALFKAFGAKNLNHLESDEYASIYATAKQELSNDNEAEPEPEQKQKKKYSNKSSKVDREDLKLRIQKIARKNGDAARDFFDPAPFTSVRGIKNAAESVLEEIEELVEEYEND